MGTKENPTAGRAGWGDTGMIYTVLIIGFVLFSLAPTFYELSRSGDLQPNRQFELVHNFPTDYNFYLSRIRQGLEGRLTVVEKYTSEPHSGSLIHEMYLLMGHAGRLARVPLHRAGDIYHVARVVLGVTLLAAVAAYCRGNWGSQGNWGVPAFLLAVTASSWPKPVLVDGAWRFGGYMAWWSVMDSLQRITFIPHLLFGQTLIIVLVLALTSRSVLKPGSTMVFFGILGFVLGMVFPPGLLFVYAVMGVWFVLAGGKLRKQIWMPYMVFGMVSISALLYLVLMTGVYPWKRLAEVDIIRPLPFNYWEYAKAMGPIGVLGMIGGIWVLWKKEERLFPVVAWVAAWVMLLGIFAFIQQQSPLRFSEMIPHVPLGVLTAYLFYRGSLWARSFSDLRGRSLSHEYRIMNHEKTKKTLISFSILNSVFTILPVALVAIGLFHMYSSYLWQRDFVDHKIRATVPLVPTGSFVMYPLKDFVNAMWYLFDATYGEGVVLSETTAGNYIPVISGNTVYAGHDNTVAFEVKKERVKEFFAGRMKQDEAMVWIQSMRARYIFFGPQEGEDGGITDLRSTYPYLVEVYKNRYVTIYSVP